MDLHISLNAHQGLTEQIYRQIRNGVMEGRLRPGDALPSTRTLSRRLEVSRNTVAIAYDRLCAEGFLTSRVGAGTFVREGIRPVDPAAPPPSALRPRAIWTDMPEPVDMSTVEAEYDFRMGIPDSRRFPFPAWRARISRHLRPRRVGKASHIGPAGVPALRQAIARHVAISRGLRVTPQDVFVTSGSQQAVDIATRVMVAAGETVAVEDPGYPPHRRIFAAHGCKVAPVPVDREGIVVDAIPPAARLVLVTPSHQFPLGATMSMERRQELLHWADLNDAAIIEDDYDSEFRYGGRPLEPVHNLDASGRVLYVSTFSKVMLPTLRLGFLIAPHALHGAVARAKSALDWHTAVPEQAALAAFIEDGLLSRHIRRMRRLYAQRHDRIVEHLAHTFGPHLEPIPTVGGLHLSATFPAGANVDDIAVVRRALSRGVALQAVSAFSSGTTAHRGLTFGYGGIETDRIGEGLDRVLACILES